MEEYINELFKNLHEAKPFVNGKFVKSSIYYMKGVKVMFEYYPKDNSFFYSTEILNKITSMFDIPPSQIKQLIRPFANNLVGKKNLDIRVEYHWNDEKIQERVKKLVDYSPKGKIKRTLE